MLMNFICRWVSRRVLIGPFFRIQLFWYKHWGVASLLINTAFTEHKMCLFISVIRRRGAVAVYQFTGTSGNRDVSRYVNPPARFEGVYFYRGPDNDARGSLSFRGTRNSFVLIPNNGCLDTRYSITILFWVYPVSIGPLVHFNPNGLGVHIWIIKPFTIYCRVMPRSGKSVKPLYYMIKPRQWSYIGLTYNHKTGVATLWDFSIPVVRHVIGRFRLGLATNYPIYIGQKPNDKRRFRGRISCLQIYNYAMDGVEMRSKMTRCYKPGV